MSIARGSSLFLAITLLLLGEPAKATIWHPADPGSTSEPNRCQFAGIWSYSSTSGSVGGNRYRSGLYFLSVRGQTLRAYRSYPDIYTGRTLEIKGNLDILGGVAEGTLSSPVGPYATTMTLMQDGRRLLVQWRYMLASVTLLMTKIGGGACE